MQLSLKFYILCSMIINKSKIDERKVVLSVETAKPLESLKVIDLPNNHSISTIDLIRNWFKLGKTATKLVYYFIKLILIFKMDNSTTSKLGQNKLYTTIATVVVTLLSLFLDVSPELQTAITSIIISVGVMIREWFSSKQAKASKDA